MPVIAGQGHLDDLFPRLATRPAREVWNSPSRAGPQFGLLVSSSQSRCVRQKLHVVEGDRSDLLRKSGCVGAAGWQRGRQEVPAGLGPERFPCGFRACVCCSRDVAEGKGDAGHVETAVTLVSR